MNRTDQDKSILVESLLEVAAYCLLSVVLFLLTWLGLGWDAATSYCTIALVVCFISGVAPTLGLMRRKEAVYSESSILLTMGARIGIVLGALAISTATKWQHHNSFCNCLLGYYFLFLLLQSALLIRNQSFHPPPQS